MVGVTGPRALDVALNDGDAKLFEWVGIAMFRRPIAEESLPGPRVVEHEAHHRRALAPGVPPERGRRPKGIYPQIAANEL